MIYPEETLAIAAMAAFTVVAVPFGLFYAAALQLVTPAPLLILEIGGPLGSSDNQAEDDHDLTLAA